MISQLVFIVSWGLLNFTWFLVLRRPMPAAALTLALIAILVLLSRFKHGALLMTVNFLDIMIIDTDTISFLFTIYPSLNWIVTAVAAVTLPLIALLWLFDPFRVRLRAALLGALVSLATLSVLALNVPNDLYEEFTDANYLSKCARSGVTGIVDLFTRGYLESDSTVKERLTAAADDICQPSVRSPHIVLVFDESSFDITRVPGINVPPDYQRHFLSLDGKARALLVEGAGGPSWYTEYNVLTGLSVRSYGRFGDFVTRIAAGRVERGLPQALRRCGYKTFSLYPMLGAFASAREFQKTTGIEHFLDAKNLGARSLEPDSFYYDNGTETSTRRWSCSRAPSG